MWMKCIDGCRYFRSVGDDGNSICSRVPTPIGVDPLVGCYWGEPGSKIDRSRKDNEDEQGKLF